MGQPAATDDDPPPPPGALVRRHRLSTRIWHMVNVVAFFAMLMSGLMIFNAHPRLYWGHYGANSDKAWLAIGASQTRGLTMIGTRTFDTTGVLGRWMDGEGVVQRRAFPWWATIPSTYSLSAARRWHLAFAWLFASGLGLYLLWSLANRHLRRDVMPRLAELSPAHLWAEVKDHARLRFPAGAAALRYNSLQKISYALVLLLLLPLMVLSGLGMSPGIDAGWPWIVDLLGGRQSARSIHFITAFLLVGFTVVHLAMVVLAGPFNEIRSMITGWFRLPRERARR